MNPIPGMRVPVAKLIRDIENINDFDVLYKYVEDISFFYTSGSNSLERVLDQYEIDLRMLVQYYNRVYVNYAGYEPKTELEKVLYPAIKPNAQLKVVVSNLIKCLEFLVQYAASNKIFLSLEKLEEIGLKNVKLLQPQIVPKVDNVPANFECKNMEERVDEFRRINVKNKGKVERVIESVFDSVIGFYKAHGYIINLPEIPKKLQRAFKYDKQNYWKGIQRFKDKDLKEVALEYQKADYIEKSNTIKPIFREFVAKPKGVKDNTKEFDKLYQEFYRILNPGK